MPECITICGHYLSKRPVTYHSTKVSETCRSSCCLWFGGSKWNYKRIQNVVSRRCCAKYRDLVQDLAKNDLKSSEVGNTKKALRKERLVIW